VLWGIVGFFGLCTAGWLDDKIGRRVGFIVLLIWGAVFMTLWVYAVSNLWLWIFGLAWSFGFLGFWGPSTTLTAEIFPTRIRGVANGVAWGHSNPIGVIAGSGYIVRELSFSPKETRIHKWDQEFESTFLQQRVCELSVPERRTDRRERPVKLGWRAFDVLLARRSRPAAPSSTVLKDELEARGIKSKSWTSAAGRLIGNKPFSRGALYLMLQNRLYRGEIVHKRQSHPGEHPAIIDPPLWDAVQGQLGGNTAERNSDICTRPPLDGAAW
jgi:hypothetical protein